MLRLEIGSVETYDEETQTFGRTAGIVIELEHSLDSLSKWEAKYKTQFLGPKPKTTEETLGYIEAMIVTPNIPPDILQKFTQSDLEAVNDYINESQTATTFPPAPPAPGKPEIISSELVYYWMTAYKIPFEAETWNLSRLFALIRVCNLKHQQANSKNKKSGALNKQQLSDRAAMNEARKAAMGTRG